MLLHKGQLIATSQLIQAREDEPLLKKRVRYRTVGDMTCTAAIESEASTVAAIIGEIIASDMSERGQTRIDDRLSEAAMEDRKAIGYF